MFRLTVAFVVIACFVLTAEAFRLSGPHDRVPNPRYRDPAVDHDRAPNPRYRDDSAVVRFFQEYLQTRSCIELGKTGCEANNANCCRKGDRYTGTMRKCRNTGDLPSPVYTCMEA